LTRRKERAVIAHFYYAALVENDDLVCVSYGAETVRDDDHCPGFTFDGAAVRAIDS